MGGADTCLSMGMSLVPSSTKIPGHIYNGGHNRPREVRRSVWVPWDWLLRLPHDFRLPGFRVRRDLPDFHDFLGFGRCLGRLPCHLTLQRPGVGSLD